MADNNASSGGIGFGGALLLLLIGLKLGRVIDWSWWWVMSPVWIPLAVVLLVVVGIGVAIGIGAVIGMFLPADDWKRKTR